LEITDTADILAVIERCDVFRLALALDNHPYIVPMNFGYEYTDGRLTLYCHCAKEGKKLDIIRANPNVCFEMDSNHKLITGKNACDYTMNYESVIGFGQVSLCDDISAKEHALHLLMQKYSPDKHFSFTRMQLDSVVVLKLLVDSFTGKRHL